ncbi:zinc finger BED domain-containing protein 4-like, partial [Acyrthosiphon pisum]|uniref:HAT C-terminal dimerisation domain-containing protein n=1 Tax=Acyrthosiphon pisum TaxID=7029 RepID=A0A8R1W4K8_ACYPI
MFESKAPLAYNSSKALHITDLIAKMIAKDQLPFHHVEKQGFKNLVKFLEHRYTIPDRTTFSRNIIPKLYLKVSQKICEIIKNMEFASFTTDLWSSNNNTDYLSLTCHFIDNSDNNFIRENILLEVIPFKPMYHLGEDIYTFTIETLEKWGIKEKQIHVFLRDNAPNMVKAFSNRDFFSFGCFSHSLQLVITDVLWKQKNHEELLKKVRQIVGHFKHSISANKLLNNYQKQEKLPERKFIQDVTTRWNSTYLMITRFLEQKKSVIGLAPYIHLKVSLTSEEWVLLDEISKVLEIFYLVTLTLSKETSSLSEVIPVLRSVSTYLEKEVNKSNKNPRFKDRVFSGEYEKFQAQNNLKLELDVIYRNVTDTSTVSPEIESEVVTINQHPLEKSIFSHILPDHREPMQCNSNEAEIEKYLTEDLIDEKENIYEYWSKSKLIGLKKLAAKYHSSPSTSVDSERAFSTAGYLDFLCNNLPPMLENVPLNIRENLFFQQDGAPAHNAIVVRQYLNDQFGNNWMGTNGPIAWPARSPDLTPLDFFLWGHLKTVVYADPPINLQHLKQKITEACSKLTKEQITAASQDEVKRRLQSCLLNNGENFEQFI